MSSNTKETYIREVLSKIDNVFLRRRLKQELSAHFDDALADLSFSDPSSQDKVIHEMGDPTEIATSINHENPSLLGFVFKMFNQGKMVILVLVLCLMGVAMVKLYDQWSLSQLTIAHLSNQIDNLSTKVKQIDSLRTQLTEMENGNEMTYLLAQNYNTGSDLFRPISASARTYSLPTGSYMTTTLRPLSLPLYIQITKEIPGPIRIEENFGLIRFVYQTDHSSTVFYTIELKTQYQLRSLRGYNAEGELRLVSTDIDLNNGLFIIKSASLLEDSDLTPVQVNEIQNFLRMMSVNLSSDYPRLVSIP